MSFVTDTVLPFITDESRAADLVRLARPRKWRDRRELIGSSARRDLALGSLCSVSRPSVPAVLPVSNTS